MAVELPEFLPLEEAARRYKVGPEMLKRAVESGKIRAVRANGKILVAGEDIAVIIAQIQANSEGDELVTISEAARRLGIPHSFVANWVRYGWLKAQPFGARAKLVSLRQAEALAELKRKYGKRGSRLIKRGQELAL